MFGTFQRLHQQVHGIANALQDLGAEERATFQPSAALGQRDQVTRQIAAVYGGNVHRVQRLQITRVVPVEKMTAHSPHGTHRLQGGLEPVDHLLDPNPTKIVGDHRAQKTEAHVRR